MDIDSPDSPGSALKRLTREAEDDRENHSLLARCSRSASAKQLRAWRKPEKRFFSLPTPPSALNNEELDKMFPDINECPVEAQHNRWTAHQLRRAKIKRQASMPEKEDATSEMGLFGLLPGELRNVVYRLAFVPLPEEQPVRITGSELICGSGACVHSRMSIAAPGMASTCRQIREEIMPIYCAENYFHFDPVMVRNRCVGRWVKTMRTYARFIPRVVLEVVVSSRDVVGGTKSVVEEVLIVCPVESADNRFSISFGSGIPLEKIRHSGLEKLVEGLNHVDEHGRARKLAFLGASDELAELVYRCKK